jgi:hypothetical protein
MGLRIKESLIIILLKDKEVISGLMEGVIRGNE